MEEVTPRTIIQGFMDAAQTNETERPNRKRRHLTRTPEVDGRLSRSLPSTEIRLHQQDEDMTHEMNESTPVKTRSMWKKRESLVDSVRRKRFHFQHSDSPSSSQSKITQEISQGSGLPRRKSPRIATQMESMSISQELSSASVDDSQISAKVKTRRERSRFHFSVREVSTTSPMQNKSGNLLSSKNQHVASPLPGSSTSRRSSLSGKEIEPTILRSSPRTASPRKQNTPVAQTPSQSAGRQQDLSEEGSATLQSTPRRTLRSSAIATSSSKTRNLTGTPSKWQTEASNEIAENSRLDTENMPLRPNTQKHWNAENALSANVSSSERNRKEVSGESEDLMETPRKDSSLNEAARSAIKFPSTMLTSSRQEASLVRTPDKSSNQNLQNRTPNKSLRSADFQRVKMSASKILTQSRIGSPSKIESPSRKNTTPRQQRDIRSPRPTSSPMKNIADRSPLAMQQPINKRSLMHDTTSKETVMTPVFERTALGPRHSSPLSRTHHISMTGDENLPDVSMIEHQGRTDFQDEFDRTELFRLKTPHLGPARPHIPSPSDSPTDSPITQTLKKKPAVKSKTLKKPRVKVQSSTLPASTIKQTFSHFCKMRVDKDTLPELVKITEEYFDQVASDLEAFAHHAGRRTIDERDVELLLKRQKFITKTTSLTHLVEKHLPLELRQEIIPVARSGNKIFPQW
ncbi:centromere protein T-like [Saccostrea echinata]|uniref:centromere protein T-like n=1 Tax=Saccostrea echinata TaxID=191078 RepID=UPI002A83625B|nr:centromere protein T-like [Saccostrea echinata]